MIGGVGVQGARGPDVGEARFLPFTSWITAKNTGESAFSRWLLSSVDTDLWMIGLLRMSCGRIVPHGEGAA